MFGVGTSVDGRTTSLPYTYVGDADAKAPHLSPMYGDYAGFPPMFILNGDWEILMSDGMTVSEKAKAAGGEAIYKLYSGMWHGFVTVWGMLRRRSYRNPHRRSPISVIS